MLGHVMTGRYAVLPNYGEPSPLPLSQRQRGILVALDTGLVTLGRRDVRTFDGKVITSEATRAARRNWIGPVKLLGFRTDGRATISRPLTPLGEYHLRPSYIEPGVPLCPRCGGDDYGPLDDPPVEHNQFCMTCDYTTAEDPMPPRRPSWRQVAEWCAAQGVASGLDESRRLDYVHMARTGVARFVAGAV